MSFSSKQYSWADVSISLGGKILQGATEVEYTEKQDKEAIFGRGSKPHAIARGNKTYEGKLSIWQSELEALVKSAPQKDVLSLTFDLVVSYVPEDGLSIVTDILRKVEFTEVKKAMKQGDKNMIVEMPIVFIDVKQQQ